MKNRKQYSAEFKTEVVLRVLREENTVNEIASEYGINPVMVSRWKAEFLQRASDVFKCGVSEAEKELEQEKQRVERLVRKVGQLTYELDWVKKKKQKSKSGEAFKSNGRAQPGSCHSERSERIFYIASFCKSLPTIFHQSFRLFFA